MNEGDDQDGVGAFLGDADVLTVEEVSRILRCSPDTVRRIPRNKLPVYRPAKRNIYLREDLIRYVRSCRIVPEIDAEDLVDRIGDVLGSGSDGVRERSRRRAL
jgi:hypothetical protein